MFDSFWAWVSSDVSLTFGQLANVQTVGLGLYLALAVVQALSTTGVAGLSRRILTLRSAVISSRMRAEMSNIRRLSGQVSGLEIQFHDLNRRLLVGAFVLFAFASAYFAYCTIWQQIPALRSGLWFTLFYYLALPVFIFAFWAFLIWKRCRSVAQALAQAERRIQTALLGL